MGSNRLHRLVRSTMVAHEPRLLERIAHSRSKQQHLDETLESCKLRNLNHPSSCIHRSSNQRLHRSTLTPLLLLLIKTNAATQQQRNTTATATATATQLK